MFNFGNLGEMMKMFKTMQENMEKAKEELRREEIVVEVGGGMVKIVVNGLGEAKDVFIDKTLLTEDNQEILQDLLVAAINEANSRSKEVMSQKLSQVAGLPSNLPGLNNLI
ncbi:MAG: YbaB/EbfC family nucleoid-associated protein [Aquificae bacterium]|nr:YbaB/EbfC family nucleoid-associated protein [Aquificota bacterium]